MVCVCGAAGLLGSHVSRILAAAGAHVLLLDVDKKKGQRLKTELSAEGYRSDYEYFNVTDMEKTVTNLKRLIQKYKRIDVWVNAAYPRTRDWACDVESMTLESLKKNVDMQMNSAIWLSRAVALEMQKRKIQGSVINFGSIYGMQGNDFSVYEGTNIKSPVAYAAIKAGIMNASRYCASYFGKDGIRFNTVCPGGIFDNQPRRFVRNYEKKVPLRRMGTPEDVAPMVLFLASQASSYVTGATLVVDGGWTIA